MLLFPKRPLVSQRVMLGIVLDDEAKNIVGQGREIMDSNLKPKKENIVQE